MTAQTFHQFALLPAELQIMIWQATAAVPCVVSMHSSTADD